MTDFFLIIVILIILLCLFTVLTERKLLAHVQRRFGPSIMGRNGWLQILVDLVKLLNKEFFIVSRTSSTLIPVFISLFYITQLLFIQNFIFGPSMTAFDRIDGLIFYHLILVILSNILLTVIGYLSQSKYSIIAIIRGVVHVVSVDVFITISYILIIFCAQSGHFHDFTIFQAGTPFLVLFAPLISGFIIILLVITFLVKK